MENIKLEPVGLNNSINILSKDVEDINDVMTKIIECMTGLDKSVWDSYETKYTEESVIPYLVKERDYFSKEFQDCVLVLKDALERYLNTNESITRESNNLE